MNPQNHQRNPIDPRLLEAARTGDMRLLNTLDQIVINFEDTNDNASPAQDQAGVDIPNVGDAPPARDQAGVVIPDDRDVPPAQDQAGAVIPDDRDVPPAQDQAGAVIPDDRDVPPAQDQAVNVLLGVTIGGNTALHIAATRGHLEFAQLICQRERSLVVARNVMLETPLHCAVTAGHLEVARVLMSADPRPANMVDEEGISPLYLAAMAGSLGLFRAILGSSSTTPTTAASFPVSYAGPNGQTALHAAAFHQNSDIARELLEWKEMLAKRADNSRSTPLHYAALAGNDKMVELLLQKNTALAYMADSSGLFPVHAAAIMGKVSVIDELLKHCPDSDELLDNKGRNLLHTAVEHKRLVIVRYVCKRSELVKLMNARDYEGNTPLHLAVRKGEQEIVSLLIENKRVNLNARNKEGRTPLDLSVIQLERGLTYFMNPSNWILLCLIKTGARSTPSVDQYMRNNVKLDSEKESKKYLQMNQSLIITSVLIATVTFAAAFTLPGGYNTDGTPNLAGSYTFKAFVIADILAFIFSVFSTFWNTLGGSEGMHPKLRDYFVIPSFRLVLWATRSLVAAFALGIYLVLAPINNSFGLVVCVITSTVPLFLDTPTMMQVHRLAITTKSRVGWNGLYKSHANPHVNYSFNVAHYIIRRILGVSWIYVIIFMLPLILEKI